MKNFSIFLSTVAIILAAVAIYSTCKCKSPAATGSINQEELAAVLTQNPKIIGDALNAFQRYQAEEQERALNEMYISHAKELNDEGTLPFVGPKDAKVTVVEFFDFNCGYCKRLSSAIEKIIADNADVKVVFKPLTFLGSTYQAKGSIAAYKQGKFLEYYKEAMDFQGRMTEADVDAIATKLGLNIDQFKADLNSDATNDTLSSAADLAQTIQVDGVPMVFVNAKRVPAMSPEPIQEAINAAK